MGTPEIAARCLECMLDAGLDVVGAVTGKDKPRGRGNVMTPTAVKALAVERAVAVYTPDSLRTEEFSSLLAQIDPELIVVVAYGKILPPAVLDYPKHGCINLHVSLLPKYRGAAPMQRAVMSGDKETGVTVMYMAEGLDTGDIISQERFAIGPEDDFEAIHDRSYTVGGPLLVRTVADIEAGRATRTPQSEEGATYAAKIEKEDARIDFSLPASVLDPIIRGVTPIPGAFCYQGTKMLKINKATPVSGKGEVGKIIAVDAKGEGSFTVACGEGALKVTVCIPEGKGKMSAGDMLRGRKIALGDILS